MNTLKPQANSFDIKNILMANKFVPIYLERKNVEPEKLVPYSVELHLTSFCNYHCYHCSYGNRNQVNKKLEQSIIDKLMEDLCRMKPRGVYFSGGGEPTTLVGFDAYIEQLINCNIEVALITNGSLITEKHLKTISKLNYIAVSIYSTHQEVYQKITQGNNFDAGFKLPGLIKELGGNCLVGARCVINKYNYSEVLEIYLKAIQAGYDYVIFIPEIDYESNGIVLTKEQVEELIAITTENISKIDERNTNLKKLIQQKFGYYKFSKETPHTNIRCQAINLRTNLFVNYDGGLYLCQPRIGNPDFCIGNLHEARLSDNWNSKRHLEVIEKLNAQWVQGKCDNCRSIAYTDAVFNFEKLSNNVGLEIVKDCFI